MGARQVQGSHKGYKAGTRLLQGAQGRYEAATRGCKAGMRQLQGVQGRYKAATRDTSGFKAATRGARQV